MKHIIYILGWISIFVLFALGDDITDDFNKDNNGSAEKTYETNKLIEMPPPYMYKHINDRLSEAGERLISVIPTLSDQSSRLYRVIIYYSGRQENERRRILILSISGRAGLEQVEDEVFMGVLDMNIEAQDIAIKNDRHAVVVRRRRLKMDKEAAEDWFDLLWWTELFSLPPDPGIGTDHGIFRPNISSTGAWVFERHDYMGSKAVLRSDRFAGAAKAVKDYAEVMIEDILAQPEMDD